MSFVFSNSIVFQSGESTDRDLPVIGYHNIVTIDNISSTTEDVDFPVTNLANPSTALKWKAQHGSPPQVEDIHLFTNYSSPINYVGIAKHNFASGSIPVTIGYIDDQSPGVFQTLVQSSIPTSDAWAVFRFTRQVLPELVVRLGDGTLEPEACVLYVGDLLLVERKLWVGHSPLTHSRRTTETSGRSEAGNFLGRVVLNQFAESKALFTLIDPDWYRLKMVPFVDQAQEFPFFFANRPHSYPNEGGFAWLMDDPRPVPEGPSNLVAFELNMQGIVV